jgi:hypothetical protein
MRNPEVIKKGLVCHGQSRTYMLQCSDCEYHGQGLPHCREAVHEDAIALIEQLQAQVPKWISVEDRLPEPETSVLFCGAGWMDIGWITDGGWRSEYINDYDEGEVTHWMTLPEPPQEDNNVETN